MNFFYVDYYTLRPTGDFLDITGLNDLQLLDLCIEKWEIIERRGVTRDGGRKTCALCRKYNRTMTEPDPCNGCPVAEYTGSRYCHGTPYWTWDKEPTRDNAYEELEFLRMLRDRMDDGQTS